MNNNNSPNESNAERNNEEQKVYNFVQSQRVVDASDLLQFSDFHSEEVIFEPLAFKVITYRFNILTNPIPLRINFPKVTFVLSSIRNNQCFYTCKINL